MYDYNPSKSAKFNIDEAHNQIAAASFLFESKGYLEIWIYLKDEELQFYQVELKHLRPYLVAHYPCHEITHNFSSFDWQWLGSLLVATYLSMK